MRAGHGRGYYGEGQLAQPPARPRRSWTKWALAVGVVGAGAAIWFMWPRKSAQDGSGMGPGGEDPRSTPPAPVMGGQMALPPAQLAPSAPQLSSPCFFLGAEGRGYVPSHGPEGRGYSHSSHVADGRGFAPGPHVSEGRSYSHSSHVTEGRGYVPGPGGRSSPHGVEGRDPLSQQAYEDAVVASARQLQATGARVVLAPHLAHLAPRIGV